MTVSLDALLERSEKNMGGVNPSLKDYALELIKRCYKEGIYVQLSSGYRSHEDQAKLFGQGRSNYIYKGKQYGRIKDANGKQLKVVTNAEPGQSIHNYGLAIDYFLVSDDGEDALWTVNDKWKRVAAIAKKMGFEWGGDWKTFVDYPHLQYTKGLTLTQIGRGSRPAFPKLIVDEVKTASDPKPVVKPVLPKTEVKGVSKAEEYKKNAQPSKSLADKFKKAVEFGITDGTYPQRPMTREEGAVMIVNALESLDK
jgi:peptidoglycan L-alanyl-D-glutamate endopeptidase CwlK